jgi:hypothetical protein
MIRPDGCEVTYCTLYELQVIFGLLNYDITFQEIKRILEEAPVSISGDYSPVFTLSD